MRIERIESWILKAPLGDQAFWSSQCRFGYRKSLLVRVETSTGIGGWGEGGQYGPAEPVQSALHSVLAPMLLGLDPRTPEVHWERMYAATRDFGRKGSLVEAISALDIALWDVTGREAKAPIHALFGGAFRSWVGTYATGLYYRSENPLDLEENLERLREEARAYSARGFPAVKMKIGLLRPEEDLRRVAAAREILGDRTLLMVDANHAYLTAAAVRMARMMEPYGVFWFEEPVAPEDVDGYCEVRRASGIPIAGGECEYTRYGFLNLFQARAVDIAQPDVCVAGGLSEARRIATLASAFHVRCMPHVWGSAVGLAAGLHLLASLPSSPSVAFPRLGYNEPLLEWDANPNPLRTDLLVQPIQPVDGKVPIPDGPGLGIEVDESVLERYASRHVVTDRTGTTSDLSAATLLASRE